MGRKRVFQRPVTRHNSEVFLVFFVNVVSYIVINRYNFTLYSYTSCMQLVQILLTSSSRESITQMKVRSRVANGMSLNDHVTPARKHRLSSIENFPIF